LHRLVLESPLLNRDNRALQVTYNPMGSPEIQSDIVDIHRRENFTKLAKRAARQSRSESATIRIRKFSQAADGWRGRVAAADYSAAALSEPDMRTTHPALWIDI
jgi:hypothetical protein